MSTVFPASAERSLLEFHLLFLGNSYCIPLMVVVNLLFHLPCPLLTFKSKFISGQLIPTLPPIALPPFLPHSFSFQILQCLGPLPIVDPLSFPLAFISTCKHAHVQFLLYKERKNKEHRDSFFPSFFTLVFLKDYCLYPHTHPLLNPQHPGLWKYSKSTRTS